MTDYYRVTEHELAVELIVTATRFLVEETWGDADQGFKYISHPSYELGPNFSTSFLFVDGLVYRGREVLGDSSTIFSF